MGDIQAVFNKVIDAGIYPEEAYMCVALGWARDAGVINGDDYDLAREAIRGYIGDDLSMRAALIAHGQVVFDGDTYQWASTHGVEFYRNWADRPEVHNADS